VMSAPGPSQQVDASTDAAGQSGQPLPAEKTGQASGSTAGIAALAARTAEPAGPSTADGSTQMSQDGADESALLSAAGDQVRPDDTKKTQDNRPFKAAVETAEPDKAQVLGQAYRESAGGTRAGAGEAGTASAQTAAVVRRHRGDAATAEDKAGTVAGPAVETAPAWQTAETAAAGTGRLEDALAAGSAQPAGGTQPHSSGPAAQPTRNDPAPAQGQHAMGEPDMDQLAAKTVRWQHLGLLGRDGSARIRLSPPELGSVEVTLRTSNDVVRVHLTVESESVRQLLQGNSEKLSQGLLAHGLRAGSIEVAVQTAAGREADQQGAGQYSGGSDQGGFDQGSAGRQGGQRNQDSTRPFDVEMAEELDLMA